ncbi:MAG: trypsin-like peptidase domain-containing protein, partial [Bacillota bacterium]|nr:trypsin-like peptidase domain-containing protein [Bacillota bacterium]
MIAILATGLVGALIGGFLSAGIVISVYTNKTQTKPALPDIQRDHLSKSINVNYGISSYPVVDIAKNVGPAVVTICNFQSVNGQESMFECSDLGNEINNNLIQMGSGSGFIIDAHNGFIVTNNHVIKGAQKLSVCLADGNHENANVVGADSHTDLAVIKISNTSNLTEVELGDSSKLQVGEPVVVIGNPGGEKFAGSVTTGVVSAMNRIVQD